MRTIKTARVNYTLLSASHVIEISFNKCENFHLGFLVKNAVRYEELLIPNKLASGT